MMTFRRLRTWMLLRVICYGRWRHCRWYLLIFGILFSIFYPVLCDDVDRFVRKNWGFYNKIFINEIYTFKKLVSQIPCVPAHNEQFNFPKNKTHIKKNIKRTKNKNSHHMLAINLRQSFDTQSFGKFQQLCNLILKYIDLAWIHKRNQRCKRWKAGMWWQYNDGMHRLILHTRLERMEKFREECTAAT